MPEDRGHLDPAATGRRGPAGLRRRLAAVVARGGPWPDGVPRPSGRWLIEGRWPVAAAGIVVAIGLACAAGPLASDRWTPGEIETLRSLWIGGLEMPPDPSNRWADDEAAARLGHRLFFDPRLSSNGRISCGSCHLPDRQFQDDVPLARGVGTTDRRTMPVAGTAHSPWQFWDGRKDSQWAQALGPLESPVEHGGSRAQFAHLVAARYRTEYEALFGALPDLTGVPPAAGPVPDPVASAAWDGMGPEQREAVNRVFASIGKAIAAYERRIGYGPSRFDAYVEALLRDGRAPMDVLTRDEVAGLRLFIGRANCLQCHNGPLLTDHHFHNTGVPAVAALPPDLGRAAGVREVLEDEFNCLGRFSDAGPGQCGELEFLVAEGEELTRAFKTPSLRNVAERPPYMHAGQLENLQAALDHYNLAPPSPAGRTELKRLRLSRRELTRLEAYLGSLSGPLSAPPEFLRPPQP